MFSVAITEIFEDFFSVAARYQIVSSSVKYYYSCVDEVFCYSFLVSYLSVVTAEVTNKRSFTPPFRISIVKSTATLRDKNAAILQGCFHQAAH